MGKHPFLSKFPYIMANRSHVLPHDRMRTLLVQLEGADSPPTTRLTVLIFKENETLYLTAR
jgi:hypothetical protein